MKPGPHQFEEDAELAIWMVRELSPGESVTYHTGNLLTDRRRAAVRALANEVYWRARAGQILLTQKRLPPATGITRRGKAITMAAYAYIATRPRHA